MVANSRSLEDLADANLLAAFRAYARWQSASVTCEDSGMQLTAGATDYPASFANAALRVDSSVRPDQAVQRAHAFFEARKRRYTFVVRRRRDADLCAYLERIGFERMFDSPCMLVDRPLAGPAAGPGIRTERLERMEQVEPLLSVGIAAYGSLGLPEEEARRAFSHPAALFDGTVAGFIGYLDGRPAAIALTVFSGASAGVCWVGTVPDARGRGLGELCTRLATNVGFDRGARVVTLQASEQGYPIYARMGFREYDRRVDYRKPK